VTKGVRKAGKTMKDAERRRLARRSRGVSGSVGGVLPVLTVGGSFVRRSRWTNNKGTSGVASHRRGRTVPQDAVARLRDGIGRFTSFPVRASPHRSPR